MGETVKVIVRCRPMNRRENDLSCNCVIDMESANFQVAIRNPEDEKSEPKIFFFDGAYFTDSTTEQIYADVGYSLVDSTCEGFNGTIFAYGQTGCGKSFTMQGIDVPAQRGIIPRSFEHIFETTSVENSKFLIHCSYLEIYNEEIRDLLGKDAKQKLDLKEHPQKGVYVAGLSLHKVANTKHCEAVMQRGWDNRTTGATLMNADSSRSHSIFTITIERADTSETGKETIRAGKLNLVDLAGSERQSKTGATGDRLKEATKINLSLSALGNVISALVDGKSTHIPYRDSKLTRMLQDSLGGNTKTLMIACISPADNNYDESLSTLRYANRAKNIKNKPKVNEDPKDTMIRTYQSQIAQLKAMLLGEVPVDPGLLASLGIAGNAALPSAPKAAGRSPQHKAARDLEAEKANIEEERARIQEEYEQRLTDAQQRYETERVDKQRLQEEMESLRSKFDMKMTQLDRAEHRVDQQLTAAGNAEYSSGGGREDSEANDGGSTADYSDDFVVIDDDANIVPAGSITEVSGDSEASPRLVGTVSKSSEAAKAMVKPETFDNSNALEALVEKFMRNKESLDDRSLQILSKLQNLNNSVVGGEMADSAEAKALVEKKRKFANVKKQKLAELNDSLNAEDEGIMLNIFQNAEDRLRKAMKLLQERKRENRQLTADNADLQREFERERADLLETIRKQEREMQLLSAIMERMQPLVRRDCNYSRVNTIKHQARFDEAKNRWLLPDVLLERSHLPGPAQTKGSGTKLATYVDEDPTHYDYYNTQDSPRLDDDAYDQRLNERMKQNGDYSVDYFKTKRRDKLLNSQAAGMPDRFNGAGSAHLRRDTDEYRGDLQPNDDDGQLGLSGSPIPRKPGHLQPLAPKSARKKLRRPQLDD